MFRANHSNSCYLCLFCNWMILFSLQAVLDIIRCQKLLYCAGDSLGHSDPWWYPPTRWSSRFIFIIKKANKRLLSYVQLVTARTATITSYYGCLWRSMLFIKFKRAIYGDFLYIILMWRSNIKFCCSRGAKSVRWWSARFSFTPCP